MIPDNFKVLIEKLTERTMNHKAIWLKTSREDEYKLDLGHGAITLDRWNHPDTNVLLVDICILNERGDTIDKVAYLEAEREEFKQVSDLHTLAKRSYYKVDETFKIIFKELDSDKVIGKKPDN